MTQKKDKKDAVKVENASSPEYGKALKKIHTDGICPFCRKNFAKYHKNPILHEGKDWLVTRNMYPYRGTTHHFLLVHKKHIEHLNKLSKEAWFELYEHYSRLNSEYSIRGGTIIFRFGNSPCTGSTVRHLHAQLVVGNPKKPRGIKVVVG
jgi:diadenosine tetraphosphate (Ap4A) HIT family hydrolase